MTPLSSNYFSRSTSTRSLHRGTFRAKSRNRCGPSCKRTSIIKPFHFFPKKEKVCSKRGHNSKSIAVSGASVVFFDIICIFVLPPIQIPWKLGVRRYLVHQGFHSLTGWSTEFVNSFIIIHQRYNRAFSILRHRQRRSPHVFKDNILFHRA